MEFNSRDIDFLIRIISHLPAANDVQVLFARWLTDTPGVAEIVQGIAGNPQVATATAIRALHQTDPYAPGRSALHDLVTAVSREDIPAEDRQQLEEIAERVKPAEIPSQLPLDHYQIASLLDSLNTESLTQVIIRIDGYRYDNPLHLNPTRIANLLSFVESSVGPGLAAVERAIKELFPQVVTKVSPSPDTGAQSAPPPSEQLDIRALILPGGTVAYDSAFYIERDQFQNALNELHAPGYRKVVTLRGARQTGKSTFLAALLKEAQQKSQLRAFAIDFQSLPASWFDSTDTLWRKIANRIARELAFVDWNERQWDAEGDTWVSMDDFLTRHLFKEDDAPPFLLCLDEVDRVIGKPAAVDFFSLTRSFINQGNSIPHWQRMRWLFATSREPAAFITDPNQSPFNVGLPLELNVLTTAEIERFIDCHHLRSKVTASELLEYVGDRPFLTHLLLYHLAKGEFTREQLWRTEEASLGIFAGHLRHYWNIIRNDKSLNNALYGVVQGNGQLDIGTNHRLESLGLVVHDAKGKAVASCRLYREYFLHALTLMK